MPIGAFNNCVANTATRDLLAGWAHLCCIAIFWSFGGTFFSLSSPKIIPSMNEMTKYFWYKCTQRKWGRRGQCLKGSRLHLQQTRMSEKWSSDQCSSNLLHFRGKSSRLLTNFGRGTSWWVTIICRQSQIIKSFARPYFWGFSCSQQASASCTFKHQGLKFWK